MRSMTLRLLALMAWFMSTGLCLAAPRPAVLYSSSNPQLHNEYVVKPLQAMGVEIDLCMPNELKARLESRKYNVALIGALDDKSLRPAVEQFMKEGGGVFLTMPFGHHNRQKHWFPTPEWTASYGANLRWHIVEDADTANTAVDMMQVRHSFSDRVHAPVNDGVRGVLTIAARSGYWPPLALDFDDNWTVAVQWAESVKAKPAENIGRLEAFTHDRPLTDRSGLLGVRRVGNGRMAVLGFGAAWIISPPTVCPTVEAMLSAGVDDKPSDWLRVLANTFGWLAEPSIKAGWGGAKTPESLIKPKNLWPDHPEIDWTGRLTGGQPVVKHPKGFQVMPSLADRPQLRGLIGARTSLSAGNGTVTDYVADAKRAGLDYIVFLEDSLRMDAAKFDELVRQCAEHSDQSFAALPGMTFEDAQGNHFFGFGDNLKFPKPEFLLPDGRLDTTTVSRTEVIFAYVFRHMNYRLPWGWYRHRENHTPVVDYKLYNTFPVFTHDDGKPVDSALDEWLYLASWGGAHQVVALELISSPSQIANRIAEGWTTVSQVGGDFGDGTYVKTESFGVAGLRERWTTAPAWYPPYTYITNGPTIHAWTVQNNCCLPSGEFWRPDVWQYRIRVHVSSDAGLKSVTIHEGNESIFRRWLPNGAKSFEQQITLTNNQQRDLVLIVEDSNGKRAIGMEIWNRNTLLNEFICGDRCNFLGNARLRRPDGSQFWTGAGFTSNMGLTPSKGSVGLALSIEPANSLTPGVPTLPIDGRPLSWPSPRLQFTLNVPGELKEIHTAPEAYLISPEIAMGDAVFNLGYSPSEYGVKTSPLGHPYQNTDKHTQGNIGKNAWTSWYKLEPTRMLTGRARLVACNTMDRVRFGWLDVDLKLKQPLKVEDKGLHVLYVPGDWSVLDGVTAREGDALKSGLLAPGTTTISSSPGGSVAIFSDGQRIRFEREAKVIRFYYQPDAKTLAAGDPIRFRVLWMGAAGDVTRNELLDSLALFGISDPKVAGYQAEVKRGRTLDQQLTWDLQADNGAVQAKVKQTNALAWLPVSVRGLNDNWSTFVLDHNRDGYNFRAIPIRDGTAWVQVDLTTHSPDLFMGHPVVADNDNLHLQVAWHEPGVWFVEVHNPTEQTINTNVNTNSGWSRFDFKETLTLSGGSSRVYLVSE